MSSIIILCFQWLGILFVTALIHEGGHALACRFYSIPVLEFMIWQGSPRHRLQFGKLAIGWFPYGGYVATPFVKDSLADFNITLCGPLANIAVCIVTLFLPQAWNDLGWFNLTVGVYALIPIGRQKDGYRLLLIIMKWYNFRKHCK